MRTRFLFPDSHDMQPMVILDRATIPQAVIDRAKASTSGNAKSKASTSTLGKKKANQKAKAKPGLKNRPKIPTKSSRPQFVLNFPATRTKKN